MKQKAPLPSRREVPYKSSHGHLPPSVVNSIKSELIDPVVVGISLYSPSPLGSGLHSYCAEVRHLTVPNEARWGARSVSVWTKKATPTWKIINKHPPPTMYGFRKHWGEHWVWLCVFYLSKHTQCSPQLGPNTKADLEHSTTLCSSFGPQVLLRWSSPRHVIPTLF